MKKIIPVFFILFAAILGIVVLSGWGKKSKDDKKDHSTVTADSGGRRSHRRPG